MKKAIVITILLLVAGIIYVFTTQDGEQKTVYRADSQTEAAEVKEPKPEKIVEAAPASNTPRPNSGNLSPETGWSGFPGASAPEPEPDVIAQFNLGNGSNFQPKTISAKQSQRISITFTASIRDQVKIEGLNIDTYVEPMRDSTIGFDINKTGEFNIVLVKAKKVVGVIKVE